MILSATKTASKTRLKNRVGMSFIEFIPDLKHGNYARFFDLSLDMHIVAGLDGIAKKVNRAGIELFGYSEEELLRTPFIEFTIEEDRERVTTVLDQAASGNLPVHFENRMYCKDGSIKWMAWRSIVVNDEQLIYSIGRDITHEKQSESLLTDKSQSLLGSLRHNKEGLEYARLLQEALFHDPKTLNLIFPESFIFHSSKDIIGGDFYWFDKIGDKAFVACADCTGHGVPGAMLSVLGINKLHEIIISLEFPPSTILNILNTVIYKSLGKKHGDKKMNDGMDIALYSVDLETKMLNYSGAQNPLYIVRNGELTELKADKQGIGNALDQEPFTDQTFQLQNGDMLYTFTDGYPDQFGGKKNKKFTRQQFKNLLLSNAHETAEVQKNILEQTLENWRNGEEQTDDICVIGVRVN
jgi:PAS domain S-box-containing protein